MQLGKRPQMKKQRRKLGTLEPGFERLKWECFALVLYQRIRSRSAGKYGSSVRRLASLAAAVLNAFTSAQKGNYKYPKEHDMTLSVSAVTLHQHKLHDLQHSLTELSPS
jgi:hypothetical protein